MQDNGPTYPEYFDQFPNQSATPKWDLIRTPQGKRVSYLICSDSPLLSGVHRFRGRTVPHERPICEHCQAGTELRYKAFVHVFTPTILASFVLELTDHGAGPLVEWWKKNGTVRGARIEIWRKGKKENSPVMSRLSTPPDTWGELPKGIDLAEYMERIWYARKHAPEQAADVKLADALTDQIMAERSSAVENVLNTMSSKNGKHH